MNESNWTQPAAEDVPRCDPAYIAPQREGAAA
ncbi:Uncharacterised protein [Mycobacteroides abscessus subsp. abscessus]|nr:Uncharacterised protein [Mycobacteroides abscessus subsp. abscessus]SIG44922.1 Uncharacterised protein [Mycobacteroides abscessus subsp. abscessus]SIM97255.1 Uncharacterised protein [Mycobacteroides abscessus subsp. abscessus]SIN09956.1 Uncharacterised protein [Mycobacteroides abscessus subsp. abscessus]SIN15783.1 Uncharacterised protein [Mycobacteroides abscessus subsp. abscessus]